MNRYHLILSLERIDSHIRNYQRALDQEQPKFMLDSFWTEEDWNERQKFNARCLKFWVWKNNNVLEQLKLVKLE